ncbi:YcxB family protein [Oscillibacter sp.]|uniref:YcxB family protein n=1 Tax=Oscillibacter sp. TaxID=1945593 RepID=UPI00339B90FF
MELHYFVRENTYQAFVKNRRRQLMRRPVNLFLTIVLVLSPLGLFACAIPFVSGWRVVLLGVLLVGLSAGNYYFRQYRWKNSSLELKMRTEAGCDFWKEHTLRIKPEGVSLTCGKKRREYVWASFGGFEECGDLLLPIFNAEPLDILSPEALAEAGGVQAFRAAFTKIARVSLQKNAKHLSEPPAQCRCILYYSYSLDTYLRDQKDARRRLYLTSLPWNRSTLLRWTVIALMVYFIITADSVLTVVISTLVILGLCSEYLIVFTPLIFPMLRRELRPMLALSPSRAVKLYQMDSGLWIEGDLLTIDLPYKDVVAVRKLPHGIALYLRSQTILTIPADGCDDDNVAAYQAMVSRLRKNFIGASFM